MLENVMRIQTMDVSQLQKDESIRILSNTLDYINEQTSQTTIDKLVYEEFKKKKVAKLQ